MLTVNRRSGTWSRRPSNKAIAIGRGLSHRPKRSCPERRDVCHPVRCGVHLSEAVPRRMLASRYYSRHRLRLGR